MEIQSNDINRTLLCKNLKHDESYVKVDIIDTSSANNLWCIVISFIIYVIQTEYCARAQRKKEDVQREKDEIEKEYKTKAEKLQKEMEDIKAQFHNGWRKSFLFPDWRKEYFQAVNVTLDPDTAHPALTLSEDRQRVTMGEKPQDLPKSQLRFESLPCVLGQQSISSGRCYWEVKVENSAAWDLGICRNNVMRKERTYIKPEDGFWAMRLYNHEYWALTSPETQLTLKKHPSTVCIFLDYEGGSVSFYNMTDKSHIHTFAPGSFSGSLRPFFRLWSKDSGHLDICPQIKVP